MWVDVFVTCIGVVASGNAARVAWQLWRRGNMDELCKAVSLSSGTVPLLLLLFVKNPLYGNRDIPISGTFSLRKVLEVVGACTIIMMTVMFVPRVTARFLITRALRRRFDALKEGDQLMFGMYDQHETVMVSRHEATHLFIMVFGPNEEDTALVDMSRDTFVQIVTLTPGLWSMMSSHYSRRSRCELVAMVREKALDERQPRRYRDNLAVTVWQLERPARVIQRAVRRALSDPSFLMCRRRLQREWSNLGLYRVGEHLRF